MTFITRFAPSPTGPLHLGHAYSAIIAHDMARRKGGKFYVRIEDLDQSRSKRKWENQIFDDLDWLGLSWDGPVVRQSEQVDIYKNILIRFQKELGLFECNCSRSDIKNALSAPHEGEKLLGRMALSIQVLVEKICFHPNLNLRVPFECILNRIKMDYSLFLS